MRKLFVVALLSISVTPVMAQTPDGGFLETAKVVGERFSFKAKLCDENMDPKAKIGRFLAGLATTTIDFRNNSRTGLGLLAFVSDLQADEMIRLEEVSHSDNLLSSRFMCFAFAGGCQEPLYKSFEKRGPSAQESYLDREMYITSSSCLTLLDESVMWSQEMAGFAIRAQTEFNAKFNVKYPDTSQDESTLKSKFSDIKKTCKSTKITDLDDYFNDKQKPDPDNIMLGSDFANQGLSALYATTTCQEAESVADSFISAVTAVDDDLRGQL